VYVLSTPPKPHGEMKIGKSKASRPKRAMPQKTTCADIKLGRWKRHARRSCLYRRLSPARRVDWKSGSITACKTSKIEIHFRPTVFPPFCGIFIFFGEEQASL
jgi:hypothetical protein